MSSLTRQLALCASFMLGLLGSGCGGCGDDPPQPDAAMAAPSIGSVDPNPICSDGTMFTITGADFDPAATVTLNGAAVQGVTVTDSMTIIVMVAPGSLLGGENSVTVTNPDEQSVTGTFTGSPKPLMFFVDPNVLAADLTARVTIYMSALTTTVQGVSIQLTGTATPSVVLTDVSTVAAHPNQIQATVSSGTAAAGLYDVTVTDGVCSATLEKGLTIVATPDITITSVTPPFGAPDEDTPITVTTSGYPLTQTPRVYLSDGGQATALRAVTWQSATSLSAIVPKGVLTAGAYDLIVINPIDENGGHVGVLAGGFHLIAAPPVIDNVTPQSITATQTAALVVTGSNFATGSTPTAWLSECTAPDGITPPTTPLALPAIVDATATQLNVSIPANTMAASVVCVLRIMNGTPTNAADPCPAGGTCVPYADFSAIASVNGSGNLGSFVQSTSTSTDVRELPAARTRLGAVSGRVNRQARFLYAIGGDDGAFANASSDVYSTGLDSLGDMLGWTTQRNPMTVDRTGHATVRIGQFIYALGGFNGTNVVTSVERARILDPLDVPAVPTLDLTPNASGLGAGTWVYRITGVRAANYASDPAGETLGSDPINITLPDVSDLTSTPLIKVTLTWPEMTNVVSYNVYRTSAAGQDASQVQFVTNVPAASGSVTFEDTGLTTTTQTPLPIGALGKWHAVGDLTTARYAAAATAAFGTSSSTTATWFLYVGGGAGDTALSQGALLDSYEWAKVDITLADGSQTVTTFTAGANPIGDPRAFVGAYSADTTIKSNIPAGTTYVYFGTGLGRPVSALTTVADMVAGAVTATTTGDLGTLTPVAAAPTAAAGSVTIAGYLFAIGGWNSGLALQNTSAADLCPATGCGSAPPALTTWANGGGGTPNISRVMLGAVLENPFIYILGGSTNASATNATSSTERTVW